MAQKAWKEKMYRIIFESDTPKGKAFDVGLLITILASIVIVVLESVDTLYQNYGKRGAIS